MFYSSILCNYSIATMMYLTRLDSVSKVILTTRRWVTTICKSPVNVEPNSFKIKLRVDCPIWLLLRRAFYTVKSHW